MAVAEAVAVTETVAVAVAVVVAVGIVHIMQIWDQSIATSDTDC